MLGERKLNNGQVSLGLSMNIFDHINTDDLVVQIRDHVNQLDLTEIKDAYKVGGSSSYPLENMLCVFLLGACTLDFSYRNLEDACKYDIRFMWLMDYKTPDHSTFHRFHQRLIGFEDKLLKAQISWLVSSGAIDLNVVSIDGTKLQSVANKYKSKYRGTIGYHESNMEVALLDLLKSMYTDNVLTTSSADDSNKDEDQDNDSENGSKVDNGNKNNDTNVEIPENIKGILEKENPNKDKKFTNPKSVNKNYIPRISPDELMEIASFAIELPEDTKKQTPQLKELSKRIFDFIRRKCEYTKLRHI